MHIILDFYITISILNVTAHEAMNIDPILCVEKKDKSKSLT